MRGESPGKRKRKKGSLGSQDGTMGRSSVVTQRTVVTECTLHAVSTIINHKLAFFLQHASFAMEDAFLSTTTLTVVSAD